jgi:TRAP-type transport system small permease protein
VTAQAKRGGPAPGTGLRRALTQLARAVRGVVVALVAVMLGALALQVLMRYVFGQALSWSEELALFCFSWAMLLAIALGVRDGVHVRMDLLVNRAPRSLARWLERLVALAIAGMGGFVAWSGIHYVQDALGATSAAIGYPTAWLYACAPAGGVLIVVFALEHALLGPPLTPGEATPNPA